MSGDYYDHTPNPPLPEGYVEVTQDQFFKVINPLNVHPSTERPDMTMWKRLADNRIVGVTMPGWRNPGRKQVCSLAKVYAP